MSDFERASAQVLKPSRNTAAREPGQKMSDFERGSEQVLKPSRNTASREPDLACLLSRSASGKPANRKENGSLPYAKTPRPTTAPGPTEPPTVRKTDAKSRRETLRTQAHTYW